MTIATGATSTERAKSLLLASNANVDPRTALKAMQEGAQAIRHAYARERVQAAARALGIPLGAAPSAARSKDRRR